MYLREDVRFFTPSTIYSYVRLNAKDVYTYLKEELATASSISLALNA